MLQMNGFPLRTILKQSTLS